MIVSLTSCLFVLHVSGPGRSAGHVAEPWHMYCVFFRTAVPPQKTILEYARALERNLKMSKGQDSKPKRKKDMSMAVENKQEDKQGPAGKSKTRAMNKL
jgi:hypothetical protein